MTWQPGEPVVTSADVADWEQWKRESKREGQRSRRKTYWRIDYYPDEDAAKAIQELAPWRRGCYTTAINELVKAGAEEVFEDELPE